MKKGLLLEEAVARVLTVDDSIDVPEKDVAIRLRPLERSTGRALLPRKPGRKPANVDQLIGK